LTLLVGAGAFAQDGGQMRPRHPGPGGPGPGGDFSFVRGEFGFAGRVVKGAPYTGQAVTTFTQTLADGNHIQRTTTASVARDSEGRTRTEQSMAAIGSLTGSDNTSKAIFIHDPVAAVSYALDPNSHTARRMAMPTPRTRQAPAGAEAARAARHQDRVPLKSEDLGTQIVNGTTAQGKRITHSIPAGQAGNEKAIDIVTETWFSPELQTVVMSKTTDPRTGESLYKLNNVTRAEPDPALFQVPADYAVTEGRQNPMGAPQMRGRQKQ
jgi:hypothetical protein